jgi:hypothetical protein
MALTNISFCFTSLFYISVFLIILNDNPLNVTKPLNDENSESVSEERIQARQIFTEEYLNEINFQSWKADS